MTTTDAMFYVDAYFDVIEEKIAFVEKLAQERTDEPLLLCCCYIEALGSKKYPKLKQKWKQYASILFDYSENPVFSRIHPDQMFQSLSEKKLFVVSKAAIKNSLQEFGDELPTQEEVTEKLTPLLSVEQNKWLDDNIQKGTIAALSYDWVRSELVHDFSSLNIAFSKSTILGKPVPNLDFQLLHPALVKIVKQLRVESTAAGKFFWEL